MSATLVIEGLGDVLRRLSPTQAARVVLGIRLGVAEELRRVIAVYPPPPRYPIQWASVRQRRWFWHAVREGLIQAPYARQSAPTSQRLGLSWTVSDNGRIVGTRVSYAPYVQSAERQQPFHRNTGWKTDRQAVDEVTRSGAIGRIAQDVVRRVFSA